MLKTYEPAYNIIDYGFELLEGLNRGGTRWSYVVDIKNSVVYFRTSTETAIKQFNFSEFDFSADTPSLVIDINFSLEGDVTDKFKSYSSEINHKYVKLGIDSINTGGNFTGLVESRKYIGSVYCKYVELP